MKRILLGLIIFGICVFGYYQNTNVRTLSSKALKKTSQRVISSESSLTDIDADIVAINSQRSLKSIFGKIITESKNTDIESERGKQLRVYATLVAPAAHLEGIIWRLRTLAKKSGYIHYNAIQYISKAYYQNYLFGEHISHLLDFFIHPPSGGDGIMPMDSIQQFKSIKELQEFTYQVVRPSIESAIRSLDELINSKSSSTWKFKVNPDLFAGNNIFSNKTHVNFHGGNLYYLRSLFNRGLSLIEAFNIYNLDDALVVLNKLVRATAMDNIFKENGLPETLSPREMVPIIKKYSKFMTAKGDDAEYRKSLRKMLDLYELAMRDEKKSYNLALVLDDEQSLFRREVLSLNKEEKKTKHADILKLIDAAKNGRSFAFYDLRNGQELTINPAAFLSINRDLKSYLPTSFNTDGGRSSFKRNDKTRLNYNYGQPVSWPDHSFNGFLNANSGEEVYQYIGAMKLDPALNILVNFFPVP